MMSGDEYDGDLMLDDSVLVLNGGVWSLQSYEFASLCCSDCWQLRQFGDVGLFHQKKTEEL